MSCLCGQVDKRVGSRSRVQVQVWVKKESLEKCEKSVRSAVEGVGIRGIQGDSHGKGLLL